MDALLILPSEMLVNIFNHLNKKDLTSCSLCCYDWREASNTNNLWFKLCQKNDWTVKNSFINLTSVMSNYPNVVRPQFIMQTPSPSQDSRLSLICDWKVFYIQNVQLNKNWREGAFTKHDISCFESKNFNQPTSCIACNGSILAIGNKIGQITLWNVQEVPYFIKWFQCFLKKVVVTEIIFSGKYMIVVQKCLIEVWHVSIAQKECITDRLYKKLIWKFGLMDFNDDTKETFNKYKQEALAEVLFDSYICVENDLGLIAASAYSFTTVKIWHVFSGEIHKEISLPDNMCAIGEMKFYKSMLYMSSSTSNNNFTYCILTYEFKTSRWNVLMELNSRVLNVSLNNDLIILRDNTFELNLWDKKESKKLDFNGYLAWNDSLIQYDTLFAYCSRWKIYFWDSRKGWCGSYPKSCGGDRAFGKMVKGRGKTLISSINRKELHILDTNGTLLYHIDVYSRTTSLIQYLWSNETKLIVVPTFCGSYDVPVLISFL